MVLIYALIGALLGGVALIAAWPFLVPITSFTNSSNEAMENAINSTWASGTPLESIIHLWPVWTIILVGICVVLIVVMTAKKGG